MLEKNFLQKFIREKQVNVYKHTGLWQCIDTKRDLDYLENLLKKIIIFSQMHNLNNFWKNKKVLIIGSGGFKGKWLVIFLKNLGAKVIGINKTKIKNIDYKLYTADICEYKK